MICLQWRLLLALFSCSIIYNASGFTIIPQPTPSLRTSCHWSSARPTTSLPAYLGDQQGKLNPRSILRRVKALFRQSPSNSNGVAIDALGEEEESGQPAVAATVACDTPPGPRWAIAAPSVNLTGLWKPIVTPAFKQEYDDYLKHCGQNVIFRNLAKSVLGLVKEDIHHEGVALAIAGTTPAGTWKRTLISSGTDLTNDSFQAVNVTVVDPDGDSVKVESCWEDNGSTHVSWLRDKPRTKGGVFESRRFLTPENLLVCESTFHPASGASKQFQESTVRWTFEKV